MDSNCRLVGGLVISLQEIRKQIEGPSDDERFTAWFQLYASEETTGEIQRILTGGDPILKVLFTRFLAHINEERAVHYLVTLLQDDNEVVFHAARKAFEHNHFDTKLKNLFGLVHSRSVLAQAYAIEKLSFAGEIPLVYPLLSLLTFAPLGPASEPLLMRVLTAFRYLPDPRVPTQLRPLLQSNQEEIRYRTLLALGSNYEHHTYDDRTFLENALRDATPRVRQAALWILRKRSSKKDLPLLLHHSTEDADATVRQEAILALGQIALGQTALGNFSTSEVITHLVKIIVSDQDKGVVLKAEGVLMVLPEAALIRGLKSLLPGPFSPEKKRAILLLAELQTGSDHYLGYLLGTLRQASIWQAGIRQTKSDPEQLACLEALGTLKHSGAIPFLEEAVKGPMILAYAAMGSLLKIYPVDSMQPLKKFLEAPLPALLKQMILKHMILHGTMDSIGAELITTLSPLLQEDNLNIRYLTAQVLAITENPDILEALFMALLRETDPVSLEFFKKSLMQIFIAHPARITPLIGQHQQDPRTFALLLDIIEGTGLASAHSLFFIRLLLDIHAPKFRSAILRLIFSLMKHHRVTLPEVIEEATKRGKTEELLNDLLNQFRESSEHRMPFKISFDLLEPLLRRHPWTDQAAFIELLGYTNDKRAIGLLVELLKGQGQFAPGQSAQAESKHPEVARQALHQLLELS